MIKITAKFIIWLKKQYLIFDLVFLLANIGEFLFYMLKKISIQVVSKHDRGVI